MSFEREMSFERPLRPKGKVLFVLLLSWPKDNDPSILDDTRNVPAGKMAF